MDQAMILRVMIPVGIVALVLLGSAAVIALVNGPAQDAFSTTPTQLEAAAVPVSSDGTAPAVKDMPNPADCASGKFDKFDLEGAEWKDVDSTQYPGLKYWDSKPGDGNPCPYSCTVSARYTGWTLDGKSFDSSFKNGNTPIEFSLNGVITGWTVGLPGLKAGGTRRLYIPAQFAYGGQRKPGIPANSDLIFEVELVTFR